MENNDDNERWQEMKKIDIHTHILPGLDDGPNTIRESMNMLESARKQGIQKVIATPHYSYHFRSSEPQLIRRFCRKLEEKARKEISPEFRVYAGQEIFYSEDVPQMLRQGKLLTLADSPYVLIEFMPGVPYSTIFRAVRALTLAGYNPVLAHIERYGVLRQKGRVEELLQTGAYMQMNYRRISGAWYDETARWCKKMLSRECIHFLATDMHNNETRAPETCAAEKWLEQHLKKKYIEKICYKNAEDLLRSGTSGENIAQVPLSV